MSNLHASGGANKTKRVRKKLKRCSPEMCTVLFMKALPGAMETNYLLTMWNRILFTTQRFPLLFQTRSFSASSFVSHCIIVSIFQNQSVSRKEREKKRRINHRCPWKKPLGIFMNAQHINSLGYKETKSSSNHPSAQDIFYSVLSPTPSTAGCHGCGWLLGLTWGWWLNAGEKNS